ncbi:MULTISPECIES: amino acid ABC transporter permease [Bacillus]|uniref:Amino acid ABC transporter permease n=2 Tax=Bacillus TaxID=1386 RepID=A0A0M3R9E6_9BACI|nr:MULTISPECIES: amino acid ABC transporter permease [Bacillus]ALC81286.1 amino acid ABC transporter permease [Bacillus gobiensis]MBP1080295.1 polar amino acid transport system permease protein [Bacillus capparidis]MED1094158.1 amino acid ABC transporter permease [Bacillus capparidis]
MDFQFEIIKEYAPFILNGTLLTIGLSIAGILIGTILGLGIGLGKMMRNKLLSFPFAFYITFFRGTPFIVQLFIIHFGVVPMFTGGTNPILASIIGLSLNSAAYIAEVFRGGIQSIDKEQTEASRSLGLTHVQTMRYIILPQAFKRIIPPMGNEFIVLIKETAVLAFIAAPEIMYWGRAMQGQYFRIWEPYLTAAVIYLILTLTMTLILRAIEKKMELA